MVPVLFHHLIQTVSSPSSHVSRLHFTDLRGSSMLFCVGREGEGTEFSLAGPELLLLSCDDDRLLVKKMYVFKSSKHQERCIELFQVCYEQGHFIKLNIKPYGSGMLQKTSIPELKVSKKPGSGLSYCWFFSLGVGKRRRSP